MGIRRRKGKKDKVRRKEVAKLKRKGEIKGKNKGKLGRIKKYWLLTGLNKGRCREIDIGEKGIK